MLRRIRQGIACCGLSAAALTLPLPALAQDPYDQGAHLSEEQLAVTYIAGRYASPITCKKTDGTVLDLEDSIVMKAAPEVGGDNGVKVTFFGIDVPDVSYCYSLVNRRVVDRRGTIVLRYLSHNRKDLGDHDFKHSAATGSLTYSAAGGDLNEHGIGTDPGDAPARILHFEGANSRMVVAPVQKGSDGFKLFAEYDTRPRPAGAPPPSPKRFAFHFFANDGSEFIFYAVEEDAHRRR